MKFIRSFFGCKAGAIYPTKFEVGDDCPPELEAAALSAGALAAMQDLIDPDAKSATPDTVAGEPSAARQASLPGADASVGPGDSETVAPDGDGEDVQVTSTGATTDTGKAASKRAARGQ